MVRYVVSVLLGGAITFGLFYLMHTLVALADARLGDENRGRVIEFVRLFRFLKRKRLRDECA